MINYESLADSYARDLHNCYRSVWKPYWDEWDGKMVIMKFVYLATFVLSVILVNNTNNGVPAQSNNLVKELNESISLPLVVLPHVAYAALDDASFQDCWNQLLHRTGISANLMPEDLKNKMEHEILAGNLSAGSSNSINIFNNTMNNVPDFMKEQLSTCMNTGVLP